MDNDSEQKPEQKRLDVSKFIAGAKSLLQGINKKLLLLILAVLLAALAYLSNQYSEIRHSSNALPESYIGGVLLVYEAQLNDSTTPSALTVRFNYPVDAHDLTHYFSVTPTIIGTWTIDKKDPMVARYTFNKKYRGSSITFHIAKGLTSTNNKTLLDDYEWYFPLTQNTQYEPYSRVQSYPIGESIPLSYDVETVSIYKSNAYNLLRFLQYTLPENEDRGSIYDGKYSQAEIIHPGSDKIQNLKINREDNTITLDPGVYYVDYEDGEPYFIVVSSFGTLIRQDDKQVTFGAFDIRSGKKISDQVTFGLYNLTNGVHLLKDFVYTEENNAVSLNYPTRLDVVIGIYKDQVAFIPVELPSSLADIQVSSNLDSDMEIFVYTDRPIYKPGDKVFVRGIVRQDSDSLYKPPAAGQTVYLLLYSDISNQISQTATLDEFGTFNTYFELPKDLETEYSYVQASLRPASSSDYQYGAAYFEVIKYTKPEFEIKTAVEKDEYLRSDTMKFTISGNYFDGKPLANKQISYTLFTDNYYEVEKAVYNKNFNITSPGGMCGGGFLEEYYGTEYKAGTVTLNDKGEAVIEGKPDDTSLLSQKITLLAKIVDKSNNELVSAANTVVHAAEFNIFFIPSADRYVLGEEVVAPFYAENLNGDKVRGKEFSYKLVNYEYTTQGENEQTLLASGTTITDDNGNGIVKFTIPKGKSTGTKQLVVRATDGKNNIAENQKSISVLAAEDIKPDVYGPRWGSRISQTYLKISSNQNTYKVNDTVQLTIDSPREMDVLLSYERGRIYNTRYLHLEKGSNSLPFKITENLSPSITVVFSYFIDGRYYTEGLSLNVPAMHKLLNIGLTSNKKIYGPTETAELHITTKDADGNPIAAQMSVGIVDKAIYALRESATPAIHSSFYYFRPRRTNAASSLTGMGDWGGRGGGGGGGASSIGSTADVLYWNPNLQTDATGEVTIPVPLLGHKTIWKVQVMGSTITSQVGQADTEFTVTADVKGAKTKASPKK